MPAPRTLNCELSGITLRAARSLREAAEHMNKDDKTDPKRQMGQSCEVEGVSGSAKSSPGLSRSVQTQLGQRLRHFYESLSLGETPVPDRFIDIINRLEQMTAEKKPS